jgi:hypothetical protein
MQEKHVLEFNSLGEMKSWAETLLKSFTDTPVPQNAASKKQPTPAEEPVKVSKPVPEPPTMDDLPTASIEDVRPVLARLAHADKKAMQVLFKNHGLVKLSDADPQLMALLKVEAEEILNAQ